MPQTENEKKAVTVEQYEWFCTPPPVLPTQEELFDYQIETLVGKGITKYAIADPFRNRIPEKGMFLIVPPPPKELDLQGLMSKVKLNGKTGVTYFVVNYPADIGEYPTTASLLIDVEDGRRRLNTKPMVSRQNIASEGRYPYNTWRGIVHAILFPMVLSHHCLDFVDTRYTSIFVSALYLDDDKPALHGHWEDSASPSWGAPSAGSVIVP